MTVKVNFSLQMNCFSCSILFNSISALSISHRAICTIVGGITVNTHVSICHHSSRLHAVYITIQLCVLCSWEELYYCWLLFWSVVEWCNVQEWKWMSLQDGWSSLLLLRNISWQIPHINKYIQNTYKNKSQVSVQQEQQNNPLKSSNILD